jgi:hypothetical protein
MIIAAFAGVVYVFIEHYSYNISVTHIGFTLYSELKKTFSFATRTGVLAVNFEMF